MRINVQIPDGDSGQWKVSSFKVSEDSSNFTKMRAAAQGGRGYIPPGTYKKLTYKNSVVMSNTPDEISDHVRFIFRARKCKNVLINGLGLGICITAILESDIVEKITVIELSEDVIKLVGPTFKDDPRVEIIQADALEYKPPRGEKYGAVWHDIRTYITGDNLESMRTLHRKYDRRTEWQGSWAKKECKRAG